MGIGLPHAKGIPLGKGCLWHATDLSPPLAGEAVLMVFELQIKQCRADEHSLRLILPAYGQGEPQPQVGSTIVNHAYFGFEVPTQVFTYIKALQVGIYGRFGNVEYINAQGDQVEKVAIFAPYICLAPVNTQPVCINGLACGLFCKQIFGEGFPPDALVVVEVEVVEADTKATVQQGYFPPAIVVDLPESRQNGRPARGYFGVVKLFGLFQLELLPKD